MMEIGNQFSICCLRIQEKADLSLALSRIDTLFFSMTDVKYQRKSVSVDFDYRNASIDDLDHTHSERSLNSD
jgi:hypothetical protein